MPPGLITALLGALGVGTSILGQFLNRKTALDLNEKQEQFQYDYANYKNELDKVNWETQQNYNSPEAQMQRLEAAGLNPNLIYGNSGNTGISTSGIAPVMQGSFNPAVPYFDSSSLIQAAFLPEQLKSQTALNQANAFKSYKDAGLSEQQAERLSKLTPLEMERYMQETELVNKQIDTANLTNKEKDIYLEYYYDEYMHHKLLGMELTNDLTFHQDEQLRAYLSNQTFQDEQLKRNMVKKAAVELEILEKNSVYLSNLVGISEKQLRNWAVTNIVLPSVNSAIGAVGAIGKIANPTQITKNYINGLSGEVY